MSVRESFVARRRNSVQSRPALNVEEEEGEEEAEGAGNKQGSKSSLPCDTPEVLPTIAFSKEELELNAANKIKRAYKYFVVRASFFRILRLHFIKIYSSTESRYVYKNRVNGKYRITKPMYIGEEDLPVHEVYEAPADYFPSSRKDGPGFALLITVTTFDHPRIPSLSEHCRADHEDIYKALKHEYRARFNPENIISLLDPTLQEVLKAFETLRKWMRRKKQSFLVVYICTHVITAYKGEVKKPLSEQEQDCYFLLKESVWRTPETIATSSLSLRKLCILLNDLPHLSKTVILHYAHLAMPKKSVFGITKLLYPPPGFLARLSRESNAAVIGSCTIGMSLSETVLQSSTSIIKPLLSLSPNAEAQPDSELSLTNADLEKLTDYYRREWRVPEDPAQALVSCDTHKSPTYSFTRDSKTGAVAVTLPRDEEMRSFYLHYVSDEAKKVFQLPVNAAQSALAAQSRKAIKAPIQLTLSSSHCRNTYFGAACVHAFSGIASDPINNLVQVSSFMSLMYLSLQNQIQEDYRKDVERIRLETPGDQEPVYPQPANQNPVFLVPIGTSRKQTALYSVAYKCSEPPSPIQLKVADVCRTKVLLRWKDPTFDGQQAQIYRVSMRNQTRNYFLGSVVETKSLVREREYLVRNLPCGVYCQFRVEAFSHGGWSAPSAATAYVCPGQKDNPVDFTTRWSRIAIGGPLSIIDRLKAHPHVREDYIRGLQLLIVFGQREDGFHKGAVAIGVATTAIQGLKIYLEDPLIIPAALLVLGYASRSAQYAVVEQMVVEGNVVAFCRQYHTLFRHDTKVISAISFLQSCLSIVTLIPDGDDDDREVEFLENDEFGELLD